MKKQSDRTRDWRERQKAEGKTSITVVLSQEARLILTDEKNKTGESYAIIIENALQTLKKHGNRRPALKYFPRQEDAPARVFAKNRQPSPPPTSHENGGQTKILIDDFANYPSLGNIERERAEKKQNSLYDLNSREGLVTRLLRSSAGFIGIGSDKKRFK